MSHLEMLKQNLNCCLGFVFEYAKLCDCQHLIKIITFYKYFVGETAHSNVISNLEQKDKHFYKKEKNAIIFHTILIRNMVKKSKLLNNFDIFVFKTFKYLMFNGFLALSNINILQLRRYTDY